RGLRRDYEIESIGPSPVLDVNGHNNRRAFSCRMVGHSYLLREGRFFGASFLLRGRPGLFEGRILPGGKGFSFPVDFNSSMIAGVSCNLGVGVKL
ncbi:MAG: hypothetical protein L0209_01730, partial [candidate division Zixibacteria bacterium]|nr:hypothetical protein [candidate division Zixibacteria bacterium]